MTMIKKIGLELHQEAVEGNRLDTIIYCKQPDGTFREVSLCKGCFEEIMITPFVCQTGKEKHKGGGKHEGKETASKSARLKRHNREA